MGDMVGSLMGLGGGLTGAAGGLIQSKGQAESMRYNRELLRLKNMAEDADHRRASARTAGENVAAIAKSGVRREGSPLEVLADNAYNEERTRALAKAGVELEADLLTKGADMAVKQGIFTASSQILGAASQASGGISGLGGGAGSIGGGSGDTSISFGGGGGGKAAGGAAKAVVAG